jgi:hypothetical protein
LRTIPDLKNDVRNGREEVGKAIHDSSVRDVFQHHAIKKGMKGKVVIIYLISCFSIHSLIPYRNLASVSNREAN